jgi:hypothetical protein
MGKKVKQWRKQLLYDFQVVFSEGRTPTDNGNEELSPSCAAGLGDCRSRWSGLKTFKVG